MKTRILQNILVDTICDVDTAVVASNTIALFAKVSDIAKADSRTVGLPLYPLSYNAALKFQVFGRCINYYDLSVLPVNVSADADLTQHK